MNDKSKEFTEKYIALCKEYGMQISPVMQLQLVPYSEVKVEEAPAPAVDEVKESV